MKMAFNQLKIKNILLLGLVLTTLNACAAFALGGAAVGAGAIIDRRSAGAISDDNVMEVRVKQHAQNALEERYLQAGRSDVQPNLNITGYNRNLLLLGQVLSEEDKALVEKIAKEEANVRRVYNHITVSEKGYTFGSNADDTMITTRVRSRLLNVSGVYAGHVKVVTYNKIVYVMGLLSSEQQAAVNEAVRTTLGVEQVVTLYETYPQ